MDKVNSLLPSVLNVAEVNVKAHCDHPNDWSYANQISWANGYPQCKGAENFRQSPIDIITDQVVFKPNMRLEFVDYDQEVEFGFRNTHHSVSLTPISSVYVPTVKLNWVYGDLDEFELQEIHFHWGDGINKGSEHEVNDERAAAEVGFCFGDLEQYRNISILIQADKWV